jgi:hypothetical protein
MHLQIAVLGAKLHVLHQQLKLIIGACQRFAARLHASSMLWVPDRRPALTARVLSRPCLNLRDAVLPCQQGNGAQQACGHQGGQ